MSTARTSPTPWIIVTAVVAVLSLVVSVTTYIVTDRRNQEIRDELAAVREELDQTQADAQSGGLTDLLGDLLDEEGDLGDLLGGEGGLEDLLGGGSASMGTVNPLDPQIMSCLSPDGGGTDQQNGGQQNGGQQNGSIPDGAIEEQVAAIGQIVGEERGVPVASDLDIEYVSADEVSRRAVEQTQQELNADDIAADTRMLTALGAIEPGTDLAQSQLDALDAGVAGYYDPKTQELVIGSEEMDGLGAYITSHELVHAATDAAHGLPDTVEVEESAGSDAAYAALNVVEGDASLYSQRFVTEHLPMSELMGLQSESDASTQAMADMPHYVSRSLQFPYMEGMAFSCDIYTDGGWAAVNQTYENLPTTSAQILFPDRYRDMEQAVDVADPTGPSGWENVTRDTFGAADLLFLLEAPGGNTDAALSDPLERVSAWAGGEVGVWSQGEDTAMELVLADRGTATPLCETVTDYYAAAFPDATATDDGAGTTFEGANQSATVTCADDEVTLSVRMAD